MKTIEYKGGTYKIGTAKQGRGHWIAEIAGPYSIGCYGRNAWDAIQKLQDYFDEKKRIDEAITEVNSEQQMDKKRWK